ncbi:MAG: hypothetical protein M5U09_05135 [Gammaproteobacteria bacterium]|nr:hypothetical protein [Gammaproteobacteria bacterium]
MPIPAQSGRRRFSRTCLTARTTTSRSSARNWHSGESRLQTDEQVALALAVGSSGFEETARGHLEATRALEQARAAQRELTEHGRLVEDYPSEYRQLQLSEYDTVIPVLESRVAASQAEIASIIHAGESVAGLIEPGATLADSAVVRDWYSGMQAGRGASQALDDLIFDDAGELSATLVDYYDTPEMRAAFEAQYTGPEEGRAEAELNFRRDAAANHVVQSGATTRSFAGIRDLEVPGNPLVYGPGRGAVDLEQIGIQPVLDLRLDLDPTRESGSLPEDLRYLDTDDTRAAFYASASNPVQLASIGGDAGFDDVAVRAREAAYTDYLRTIQSTGRHPDPDEIDKWVDSTGRDASIALRLDVPGNPNAPRIPFRSASVGG